MTSRIFQCIGSPAGIKFYSGPREAIKNGLYSVHQGQAILIVVQTLSLLK